MVEVNCCQFSVNRNNIIQNIIICAKFWMVRALHLMENCKIAIIGICSCVATIALDCSSSVYYGEGPPQSLPVSLNRACQYLETRSPIIFTSWVALGLIILRHRYSMASNISWVSLKGKAYHSLVDKKSFHVSCTFVWLPTLSVSVPETLPQLDTPRSK